MSEELLKPCSVCGGKDIRICETEVYCGVCGHGFIFKNYDTRGKALDWWNRRAIEDALRAEIAELKAKQAQFWNAKKLRQDDACHWYVIPANDAQKFDRMMDAQDWDGINETFGDFMQSGGVEELTFYIPEED